MRQLSLPNVGNGYEISYESSHAYSGLHKWKKLCDNCASRKLSWHHIHHKKTLTLWNKLQHVSDEAACCCSLAKQ